MKKIVWLFGQPGAGRSTIVRELYSNGEVNEALDLKDQSICYADIPYDRNSLYTDFNTLKDRRRDVMVNAELFSQDNYEVLLLRGEFPDYSDAPESTINRIMEVYPEIKQEILLLCPSDLNILLTRMRNTEWFQKNLEQNLRKYPMEWLTFAVKYMREYLTRFEQYGCTLYDVDTTDGYYIKQYRRNR